MGRTARARQMVAEPACGACRAYSGRIGKRCVWSADEIPDASIFSSPCRAGLPLQSRPEKRHFPESKDQQGNESRQRAVYAEARIRLESALARFDRECRACADAGGRWQARRSGSCPLKTMRDSSRCTRGITAGRCRKDPNNSATQAALRIVPHASSAKELMYVHTNPGNSEETS
jgi:hypothetical protein